MNMWNYMILENQTTGCFWSWNAGLCTLNRAQRLSWSNKRFLYTAGEAHAMLHTTPSAITWPLSTWKPTVMTEIDMLNRSVGTMDPNHCLWNDPPFCPFPSVISHSFVFNASALTRADTARHLITRLKIILSGTNRGWIDKHTAQILWYPLQRIWGGGDITHIP